MNSNSKETNVKINCLQETWLSNDYNIALYQLTNYNIAFRGKTGFPYGSMKKYLIHLNKVMPQHENMSYLECLSVKKLDFSLNKNVLVVIFIIAIHYKF